MFHWQTKKVSYLVKNRRFSAQLNRQPAEVVTIEPNYVPRSRSKPIFDPIQGLVNKKLSQCNNLASLARIIVSNSRSFNEVNCATSWHRYGKLRQANGFKNLSAKELAAVNLLLKQSFSFREFPPRQTANAVYGIAVGQLNDVHTQTALLVNRLIKPYLKRDALQYFELQEIANVGYAFAKLELSNEVLFHRIGEEMVLRTFKHSIPQEIANIAYAFAKLNVYHEAMFMALANEIQQRESLADFTSQNLSNLLWSFAKLQIDNQPKVFNLIGKEICKRNLERFTPQEVATVCWSYAMVNASDQEQLVNLLIRNIMNYGLDAFSQTGFSFIVGAFAQMNIEDMTFLDYLEEYLLARGTQRKFDKITLNNLIYLFEIDKNKFEGVIEYLENELR